MADDQIVIIGDDGTNVIHTEPGQNGDKIRGYSADLVIITDDVRDELRETVIEPMTAVNEGEIIDLNK